MADFSSVPTVELLTRAAHAAGKAATTAEAEIITGSTWERFAESIGKFFYRRSVSLRLIAASGPDHWRAVEALLRGMLAEHDRYWRQHQEPEHHCRHGYIACHLVQAARPLAEQVLQHLGDTE